MDSKKYCFKLLNGVNFFYLNYCNEFIHNEIFIIAGYYLYYSNNNQLYFIYLLDEYVDRIVILLNSNDYINDDSIYPAITQSEDCITCFNADTIRNDTNI